MKIVIFEPEVLEKLKAREGDLWSIRQMIVDHTASNLYNLKRLWGHYIFLHRQGFIPSTDRGLEEASREINIRPFLESSSRNRFYKMRFNGQLVAFGKCDYTRGEA